MEDIGRHVERDACVHCDRTLVLIEWSLVGFEWVHEDPVNSRDPAACEVSPRAFPLVSQKRDGR